MDPGGLRGVEYIAIAGGVVRLSDASGRWRRERAAICLGAALTLSVCPALAASLQAPRPGQSSLPKPSPKQSQPAPRSPRATPSVAEAAPIVATVQAYYAALNQRDVGAALRLWSETAPEIATVRRALPSMLERSNPTWTDVEATVASVAGARARARVTFSVSYSFPGRPSPPPMTTRNVMELVNEAGEWRIAADRAESEDIAQRLVQAADETAVTRILIEERENVTLGVARALMGLGAFAAGARQQYEAAIRAYSLALRIAESPDTLLSDSEKQFGMASSHVAAALTGLAQVHVYKPQPDPLRAIELLTRALGLHERAGNEPGIADVQHALGNAYYGVGDYAEALDRYQHVLPLALKQQDRATTARTQLGIGNVQYLFGHYDAALQAYSAALEAYVANADVEAQPQPLQGLGRVYAVIGDFDRARAEYETALRLLAPTNRKSDQASFLIELGRLDFQQGRLAEADAQYLRALELAEVAGDVGAQGRALFSRGLVHMVEGQFDQAIERYTAAAAAFRQAGGEGTDNVAQTLLARASARYEQRDLPRALEDFTASRQTFEKTRNREGMARAHLGIAMVHVTRRETKVALDAATRARDLADRARAADVQWQARHQAGRAWLLAGDPVKAREAFEDAIRLLEGTRFEAGAEAESQPPAQRAAPYVALVEWHVARGNGAQALVAAEATKRRLLQDLVRPFHFRLTRGLAPDRQAAERRIANRRVSLLRQLRREVDLGKPNPARVATLEQDLAAARVEAAQSSRALARDLPALAYQRGDTELSSLDALGAALPARAALLHFVVGDERTSVIVVTRPRTDAALSGASAAAASPPAAALDAYAFTVPVSRQQLAEQVWRFVDGIARRTDTVAADGRALYDLLLAPAANWLAGRSQLVLVPDDSLWTLPFEALMPGEGRYLIQDVELTATPSCVAWLSQPVQSPRQPLMALTASGELSDVAPLQTRLTFPTAADLPPARETTTVSPASTVLAAWELSAHDLSTDDLVLAGVTPKPERLRIDAGRLGPIGLFWVLQSAGARRLILARRPLPDDTPTVTTRPLPHPHDWATWLVIGPPQSR
jgi:tetratricopeptide (TPR) repeat protein